jgi:hypothetical protein
MLSGESLGARYISWVWEIEELMARKNEIVVGDKLKLRMVSRVSDLPD